MTELPVDILSDGARALGVALTREHIAQFQSYARMLAEWNEKLNLTAITSPEHVAEKHFLDSLSVLSALPAKAFSLIDIGTGAGFPGLPLAIVRPDSTVTLVEATAKKAGFLEAVIAELKLTNVSVLVGRAETLAHEIKLREQFDAATGRAVAQLATLAELTLPFIKTGGMLIAQKNLGSESREAAANAIETLGGAFAEEKTVPLPALAERRLIIIRKNKATPVEYPRRPGIPAKKPL